MTVSVCCHQILHFVQDDKAVILSASEESVMFFRFMTQILHFVQDDRTVILSASEESVYTYYSYTN